MRPQLQAGVHVLRVYVHVLSHCACYRASHNALVKTGHSRSSGGTLNYENIVLKPYKTE